MYMLHFLVFELPEAPQEGPGRRLRWGSRRPLRATCRSRTSCRAFEFIGRSLTRVRRSWKGRHIYIYIYIFFLDNLINYVSLCLVLLPCCTGMT